MRMGVTLMRVRAIAIAKARGAHYTNAAGVSKFRCI